ncbi:MAG TPA: uracil-DNA glycosylase family protein [bacterium]|nr:uracil-DNA glycosylase family protein [bacterium]
MPDANDLLDRIAAVAATHDFDPERDLAVYTRSKQDPDRPVLFAGNLAAPLCCFARDLGKDEVKHAQPLIGAAGRRVRSALHELLHPDDPADAPPEYPLSMRQVLLTNTVPYKPVGNKEFSRKTKEVFRPFVAELLVVHWKGEALMPMGTGALEWFRPYGAAAVDGLAKAPAEERFAAQAEVEVVAQVGTKLRHKRITLMPLPHPSPLSSYTPRFPEWLALRLKQVYG